MFNVLNIDFLKDLMNWDFLASLAFTLAPDNDIFTLNSTRNRGS